MKWGVRREMGRNAREASRVERLKKATDKAVSIKEKKLKDVKEWGGDTRKLRFQVNKGKALSAKYLKRYDQLTKGLSEKDVKQGRRGALAQGLISAFLGGAPGVLLTEGILTANANRRALRD